MRTLALALLLAVALVALPLQGQAQAATEFVAYPAQFSYGTPSGIFGWNSTVYGLRFTSTIAPHLGFGTDIYYGTVPSLALGGSTLNGFSGQTIAGDFSLRFGTSVRQVDLAVYGGYEAFAMNANGSTAADRILLFTAGPRVAGEVKLHLPHGFALEGSVAYLPSLNSSENLSLSSPPTTAQFNGTGNGTEYEVSLSYSFIPDLSILAGYRGGTYQTTWSGAGSTTTTFSGWVFGLESTF